MAQRRKGEVARVRLDLLPEDRERLRLAAVLSGAKNMATFARQAVLDAVARVLAEHEGKRRAKGRG
jgi:hypothetical protein